MSITDIILALVGAGLIVFAFLFAWSMCMVAKADEDLREFIERHEGGKQHGSVNRCYLCFRCRLGY